MLELRSAELRVYHVGNESSDRADADVIIPGSSDDPDNPEGDHGLMGTSEMGLKVNEWVDEASFNWHHNDGEFGYGAITSGDRLEFVVEYASFGEASALTPYGEGGYGDGVYGGTLSEERRWTGWAYSPQWNMGPDGWITWSTTAGDFVFETLAARDVHGRGFDETRIAVDESDPAYDVRDGILNTLLRDKAPAIDRSRISTVDAIVDRRLGGRTLLEVAQELINAGDAMMSGDGRSLIVEPVDAIAPEFELTTGDFALASGGEDDDALRNNWRVDGGQGAREDERTMDDAATPAGYYRVTRDDHLTYQLEPEKNRLTRGAIWIRRDAESRGDVRVRIQKSNEAGTGPRDSGDETLDIESFTIDRDFLSIDGWWDGLRFAREILPDEPWIIIDSNTAIGHDIGLASTAPDVPALVTHYPYNVAVVVPDESSIGRYRQRDGHIQRNVRTNAEARQIAQAANRHNAAPESVATFEATSARAHRLRPGDVITADYPAVGMVGDYLVMGRSDRYNGLTIQTDVTIQHTATV